jgi:hypothetical protein
MQSACDIEALYLGDGQAVGAKDVADDEFLAVATAGDAGQPPAGRRPGHPGPGSGRNGADALTVAANPGHIQDKESGNPK